MTDLFTKSDAVFSDDQLYRYLLMRQWERPHPLVIIMLNPSTAGAAVNDRTIGRCRSLAEREGRGGLIVGNIFALRSTDPKKLRTAADPVGPKNRHYLAGLCDSAVRRDIPILCAWGDDPMTKKPAAIASILSLQASGARLVCLGVTQNGSPKHPLYLAGDTPLIPFVPAIYHG